MSRRKRILVQLALVPVMALAYVAFVIGAVWVRLPSWAMLPIFLGMIASHVWFDRRLERLEIKPN